MDIADAIDLIRPGAQYVLRGSSYAGLEWLDSVQAKPTEAEILNAISGNDFREKRRKEYPPIHEWLEALTEGGKDLAEIKRRVDDVKQKYPKP